MAVAIEAPKNVARPPHKLWTVEEYLLLERRGLPGIERYELIEGELIEKVSKSAPHVVVQSVLAEWTRNAFGAFHVLCESPIRLQPDDEARSLPEPDVVALSDSMLVLGRLPVPEDVLLVAEVSEITFHIDLTVKARLYARYGIREYWVVDLNARRIIVLLDPDGERYRSALAYSVEESVTPQAASGHSLRVGELFK